VQYGANVVFLVVNNGPLGTIRMLPQRSASIPARYTATELRNPDFARASPADYGGA